MSKELSDLQRLVDLHSPAQVAVWLGLKDPRPIHQWLHRGKIPRAREMKVKEVIEKRGPK